MTTNKYEKYIVYDQEFKKEHPPGQLAGFIGVAIDADQVPGATMHMGFCWNTGPNPMSETYKPHIHDIDEIIFLISSDVNDPWNLDGEVDFWFEHEKYTITKTAMIYVPAGVQHAPLWFRVVNRPIISGTINPEPVVSEGELVQDPMFAGFADLPVSRD